MRIWRPKSGSYGLSILIYCGRQKRELSSLFCCDVVGPTPAPAGSALAGASPGPTFGNGGVCRLAEVRLQEGESLENALRRFKRKVQQEDIIKEIKKHSFYLKPGEKRRVKEALARKRVRKKARLERE